MKKNMGYLVKIYEGSDMKIGGGCGYGFLAGNESSRRRYQYNQEHGYGQGENENSEEGENPKTYLVIDGERS